MAEMTAASMVEWLTADKAFGQECYSRKQIAALIEQQAAEIAKKDRMIADLTNIRDIQGQKGNYDQNEYMRGLFNGLEMALSIFTQQEPQFKGFKKEPQGVE